LKTKDTFTKTKSGEIFLQFRLILPTSNDSKIKDELVVFTTPYLLSLMEKSSHGFLDGTFKCAPAGYYQIVTLLILNSETGIYTPIDYFFLTSKNQDLYENMFLSLQMLLTKYKISSGMIYITLDFERGLMNTFSAIFPKIKVIGCFFHLVLILII